MPAPELVTALGVSKQSVHKLLKKLQSEGKVRRIPDPGLPRRQFWVSADVDFGAILESKALALNSSHVRVLSALQPASFHRIRDLANLLRMAFSTAQRTAGELATRGLAFVFCLGKRQYIGITPQGLNHPERMQGVPTALMADIANSFGKRIARFIETLAVLGEAKTSELTAAMADKNLPLKNLHSGQVISELLRNGIAEAVRREKGKQPHYRLTYAGRFAAGFLQLSRPQPSKQDIRQRITEYRAHRAETARNLMRMGNAEISPVAPADSCASGLHTVSEAARVYSPKCRS